MYRHLFASPSGIGDGEARFSVKTYCTMKREGSKTRAEASKALFALSLGSGGLSWVGDGKVTSSMDSQPHKWVQAWEAGRKKHFGSVEVKVIHLLGGNEKRSDAPMVSMPWEQTLEKMSWLTELSNDVR